MGPADQLWGEGNRHFVVVRQDATGQYVVQALGLPDIQATAATREAALQQVRAQLLAWLASGRLVPVDLSGGSAAPISADRIDPNDPLEQAYLEELARFRREDLERALAESDPARSNSSSTPTT